MIYWLTREDFSSTCDNLRKALRGHFNGIAHLSYERVFYERKVPRGHYIFSDFDRLSTYEIECAVALSDAVRAQSPESAILNDPRSVLERVPLLTALYRLGLNRFAVTRLDAGDRPTRFPVFIRLEDDCRGPDSVLLYSEEELESALKTLLQQGHVLKRRIAVEFCAESDAGGWYRKFGALNIGGTIIPQHILRSRDWNVKRSSSEHDEDFAREELEFVRNNPHSEPLAKIFKVAGIDFGRIDYTLVGNQVQTFEINTNPTFPSFESSRDARSERRNLTREKVTAAFRAMDNVRTAGKPIVFCLPKPRLQRQRIPRKAPFLDRLWWAFNFRKK